MSFSALKINNIKDLVYTLIFMKKIYIVTKTIQVLKALIKRNFFTNFQALSKKTRKLREVGTLSEVKAFFMDG